MLAVKRKMPLGNVLGFFWIALSILLFLGLSVDVFLTPRFPLAIGLLRTTGRSGLWITLLPTLVAVAGVFLWRKAKLGAGLLTAYSSFWFLTMLSGLPYVWNAKQSFCIRTFCITTPWLGRLMVMALATPFLLAAIWAGRTAVKFGKPG
jgi:hypothetical protein